MDFIEREFTHMQKTRHIVMNTVYTMLDLCTEYDLVDFFISIVLFVLSIHIKYQHLLLLYIGKNENIDFMVKVVPPLAPYFHGKLDKLGEELILYTYGTIDPYTIESMMTKAILVNSAFIVDKILDQTINHATFSYILSATLRRKDIDLYILRSLVQYGMIHGFMDSDHYVMECFQSKLFEHVNYMIKSGYVHTNVIDILVTTSFTRIHESLFYRNCFDSFKNVMSRHGIIDLFIQVVETPYYDGICDVINEFLYNPHIYDILQEVINDTTIDDMTIVCLKEMYDMYTDRFTTNSIVYKCTS